MAQNPNTFGFQTTNVIDTDTNTNIANSNLTSDSSHSTDVAATTLTFKSATVNLLAVNGATDKVIFGNGSATFTMPSTRPNDAQVLTASGSGGVLVWSDNAGANTNLGNTNLVAASNRTYDLDDNTLDFYNSGTSGLLKLDGQGETITIGGTGTAQTFFKSGTTAPDIRIFEASGSGTNYVKLTLGALSSNTTITIPNTTGTMALTSDVIAVNKGGTGQTSYTNGQILIGNTTGNTLAKSTLTAGTNVTITNAAGAITIASADTNTQYTAGDGITLNTLEFDLDAALTTVTTITNAALKMGRDADNLIDFASSDNQIIFRVNGANELRVTSTTLNPESNDGLALGTSARSFSDLFLASAAVINFNNGDVTITHSANLLTFAGGAVTFADGITDANTIAAGLWNGTPITQAYIGAQSINESKIQVSNAPVNGYVLTAQSGNTGGLTWVAANAAAAYTAGDGITLNTAEFDLDAALTTVTTITNAALKMGRDVDNLIDFATTDNQIVFRVSGANELRVTSTTLNPESNDGLALGTAARSFSDLFLASGGEINFVDGNAKITHNANKQITFLADSGVTIPRRRFEITSSTDGNSNGDIIYIGTTTVVIGKVYMWNGTAWVNTDADAVATSNRLLGVAIGSGASNAVGMLLRGAVTLDHDSGTAGDPIYLSVTPNQLTSTAPTGSGDVVRACGFCLDSSDGQVWFNPDNTFTEIA